MSDFKFGLMYPDVLGEITNGTRINMNQLQCALGIFPSQTFLNQPVEIVLMLQNMVDQMMQVKIAIQVPKEDKQGRPVVIEVPKRMVTVGLRPGEVGVVRTPLLPKPPTVGGNRLPIRVAVRYRTARPGQRVRPFTGGPPPSILSISTVKLQVLRDVKFTAETWQGSNEILTTYIDVANRVMPEIPMDLQARYESLWTHEEMDFDFEMTDDRIIAARRVANGFTRTAVYHRLLEAVEDRFAMRGMPLHPGESIAIAKMMTYTVDEGLELEPGFDLVESQWFKTLCQVLAYDENLEDIDKGDMVVDYLFEAALFDAIMLGFGVIEPRVTEDLGDTAERRNYAYQVLNWYSGQGDPDPSYIYLPMAMGAILINELANVKPDNPWTMLKLLREALRGRKRLFSGEGVFRMTEGLLRVGEETLRRSRIPPP